MTNALKVALELLLVGAFACNGSPAAVPDGPMVDASIAPDAVGNTTFVSNTPGATVVDVGAPPTPNLVLLSSNVLQQPSGSQIFQEWLGEVRNIGSTAACLVRIDISFKSAAGSQIASFNTYASADPYTLGSSVSAPCIPPGQVGSLYDNGFVATAAPLEAVRTVEISFSTFDDPSAAPAPHAPIVTSHVTPVFTVEFGITGTLTGGSAAIHNIGLEAYPRDASGLGLGRIVATDLGTLNAGASFPFTSDGISSSFTEYRQFADFIDGPMTAAPSSLPPQPAREGTAFAIDAARRQQRRELQARAVLAKAR